MLFRATDERARLADKRPLVDLIDSVIHPRTAQVKSPVIPHPSAVPTPVQDPLAALLSPDVSPLLASLSSFPINFSNFNIPPTNSSSIKIRPVYEEIIKYKSMSVNLLINFIGSDLTRIKRSTAILLVNVQIVAYASQTLRRDV
jgi:hypothetical protein